MKKFEITVKAWHEVDVIDATMFELLSEQGKQRFLKCLEQSVKEIMLRDFIYEELPHEIEVTYKEVKNV